MFFFLILFFFFMQKTAFVMRISDWSSDVCSSDLRRVSGGGLADLVELFRRDARRLERRQHLGLLVGGGDAAVLLNLRHLDGGGGELLDFSVGEIAGASGRGSGRGLGRRDRKSVVSGKRGSVRVVQGGGRKL